MVGFRHWEGSLAAAGIALYLARALALDARDARPSWLDLGLLAGAAGVLSLFSPQAALACYGMLGWLALRKRGWLGFAATAAAATALLLVITLPWALRNEAVFGERVWTRSSFGISFAVGLPRQGSQSLGPGEALSGPPARGLTVSQSADACQYASGRGGLAGIDF
jgi:hypothetical protein